MKKLILLAALLCASTQARAPRLPICHREVVAAVKPHMNDIHPCGNHFPPCNSDPSGDCSGCNQ